MNGKWAEACALIILVRSKNSYVCVITEENYSASQTLSSLKKMIFFIAGLTYERFYVL